MDKPHLPSRKSPQAHCGHDEQSTLLTLCRTLTPLQSRVRLIMAFEVGIAPDK